MARKIKMSADERRAQAAQIEENRRADREERKAAIAETKSAQRERYAAAVAAGEVLTIGHSTKGLTFSAR